MILTLRLDAESHEHFDDLRRRHFPSERNLISAHLTLFHQLPDEEHTRAALDGAAAQHAVFPLEVTGLRSLGRGVAYRLASAAVMRLHAELARTFAEHLIPQDRQRFDPHIVVQNKSEPGAARELLSALRAQFVPRTVMAEGLDLWRYRGGPWEHVCTFPFREDLQVPGRDAR